MPKPTFFFVGNPRSGSGSINAILAQHPEIWMARKELHYFGRDLAYNTPARSLENYESHFDKAPENRVLGETSTWLLASTTAAEEIASYCPNAKILIALREPVSWLHSLHSHHLYTGDESLIDFEAAVSVSPNRDDKETHNCTPRGALNYLQHVRYSHAIQRYIDTFGVDNVCVVLLDDLRSDPTQAHNKIFKFLGVSQSAEEIVSNYTPPVRTNNSNRGVRSALVQRFVRKPNCQAAYKGLSRDPLRLGFVVRVLKRLNTTYFSRPILQASFERTLKQQFTTERDALSALIGRDLSQWAE
jgi:hypothetical protein